LSAVRAAAARGSPARGGLPRALTCALPLRERLLSDAGASVLNSITGWASRARRLCSGSALTDPPFLPPCEGTPGLNGRRRWKQARSGLPRGRSRAARGRSAPRALVSCRRVPLRCCLSLGGHRRLPAGRRFPAPLAAPAPVAFPLFIPFVFIF